METFVRVVFGLFAALFVWAAFLQLNDAQPVIWIAIYGVGAGFCAAGAARVGLPPVLAYGYASAMVVGAGYLAWQVFGPGEVTAMYGDKLAADAGVVATKEGREMIGLLVVAAASAGYGYWSAVRASDGDG